MKYKNLSSGQAVVVAPVLLIVLLLMSGCLPEKSTRPLAATATAFQPKDPPQVEPVGTMTTSSTDSPLLPLAPTLTQTPQVQPSPTDTPQPTLVGLDTACLDGTWQVADLAQMMVSSSPGGQSSLQLNEVSGQILYQFNPDGTLTTLFQQLKATYSGTSNQKPMTVVQSLDGSATAKYQVDPSAGQLLLSNFGGQGVQFGLDVNQQRLAEGSLPAWQAFATGPGRGEAQPTSDVRASRVAATCQGDQLQLRTVEPNTGPAIHLARVGS